MPLDAWPGLELSYQSHESAKPARGSQAGSRSIQHPTSKLQRRSKIQSSRTKQEQDAQFQLDVGAWSFSGAWVLDVGCSFDLASIPAQNRHRNRAITKEDH